MIPEKLEDDTTNSIIYAVLAGIPPHGYTQRYFLSATFPNNCNFFLFGHTNLALYAHAHRLSFSVTAEDKQVETGFFGLFPETYCKLSIFDLHLSNQPKEHKRF